MNVYELAPRFRSLFSGFDGAFGTGRGQWVHRSPRSDDFVDHLCGRGAGIGIAPLRPDNTVRFAAIDLDEPDFDAAREMQRYIPGTSWIERSRSGNAHVWVFFKDPIPAWVPMGLLKIATENVGKDHVEVFPKNHDFAMVRYGNYINLPYHGDSRPILDGLHPYEAELSLEDFLQSAERSLNDPFQWTRRADLMQVVEPSKRERTGEFGEQENLHICTQALITGETEPPVPGHRAMVYFCMAKQLTNCKLYDHDEALELMLAVNRESVEPIEGAEMLRILRNAERGMFTSTGCDDPLFLPYAHPDCPIAHPRR